jgi:uncharacterized protein (TIGR02246 family)
MSDIAALSRSQLDGYNIITKCSDFEGGRVMTGAEDDVKALFEKFIAAQNAHDMKAIGEIFLDSPQVIWITRDTPLWGREAVLKRFEESFRGTWIAEPKLDELKVTELSPGVARLFVPATFRIAPPGQNAEPIHYLINHIYIKTPAGWKLSSVFPIVVP